MNFFSESQVKGIALNSFLKKTRNEDTKIFNLSKKACFKHAKSSAGVTIDDIVSTAEFVAGFFGYKL